MIQSYYVDGPMIYATKSLYQLVRRPSPWLGLQYVIRVNYYQSIEDYELLLYVILTDKIDIRHKDSYENKFKFFLNYEEAVDLTKQINNVAKPIINSLLAGQNTNTYTLMIKDRHLKFNGFIDASGSPKVQISLQHGNITGVVTISLTKFQEFLTALNSICANWHNTLAVSYYQFVNIGKAILQLTKQVNQQFARLEKKLESLQVIDNTKAESKPIQNEIVEERQEESVKPKLEIHRPSKQESTSLEDNVLSQLQNLATKPRQSKPKPEIQRLPLKMIDHIEALKPYLLDESLNLLQFASDNYDELKRIFVESGIPENNITNKAELIKYLLELKSIFNGKYNENITNYQLRDLLGVG